MFNCVFYYVCSTMGLRISPESGDLHFQIVGSLCNSVIHKKYWSYCFFFTCLDTFHELQLTVYHVKLGTSTDAEGILFKRKIGLIITRTSGKNE